MPRTLAVIAPGRGPPARRGRPAPAAPRRARRGEAPVRRGRDARPPRARLPAGRRWRWARPRSVTVDRPASRPTGALENLRFESSAASTSAFVDGRPGRRDALAHAAAHRAAAMQRHRNRAARITFWFDIADGKPKVSLRSKPLRRVPPPCASFNAAGPPGSRAAILPEARRATRRRPQRGPAGGLRRRGRGTARRDQRHARPRPPLPRASSPTSSRRMYGTGSPQPQDRGARRRPFPRSESGPDRMEKRGRGSGPPHSGRISVLIPLRKRPRDRRPQSPDLPRCRRRHRRGRRAGRAHQALREAHHAPRGARRPGRLRRAVRGVEEVPATR